MIPKGLRVSGTYLLCKGNRIHKFRIKWCSKSRPTVEQRHEVMRITEDIVKSNNLPRRITTGQLKITTKISLWSPRSKALSLRQFRSEKQGHLSAHKHSYVLRVSLADNKEREDCEHLATFPLMHSEDGWENELQSFNPEKTLVETVANDTGFEGTDGIQFSTKDAGAKMDEDKPGCQNHTHTEESVELIFDRYQEEQQCFARTKETEYIVSRIEKLVERACMAAKVYQNQAGIVGHDNEQHASEAATHSMKTEVIGCSSAIGPTVESKHDLEAEPKENFWKNSSFTITDAETVCQDETTVPNDKWVKHPSSTKKFSAAHLQVVTGHWKFGNTKVSTNSDTEMFNISKPIMHRHCTACNVHTQELPVDYREENVGTRPQACEIPLTVSCYNTLTHNTVTRNYKLPDDMSTCGKITADVAIRRKRHHSRNESDICELPKKKRVISGGISPVILGPTSFQEFSPYHTGVMSVYSALKRFENILGRTEGRNGIESNLTNIDEKLKTWLRYQSIHSRLRAVSRVNSDKELREILRYIIRNLRNRSANMAFAQQNKKLICFTPELWMYGTHSDPDTKRALIMKSEEKEPEMQDLSKESWQRTRGKTGGRCYKNSSVIHMKSESLTYSADHQQTSCVSSHSQEPRAFNKTVSMKQQRVEENNSLQDTRHLAKICEPAIEHVGESEDSDVQIVKVIKVGSVRTENHQPLEAESTENLKHMVKGNNSLFISVATSENLPRDKDKYKVETNGVVQILNFGDDFSGIVKPKCSFVEEKEAHLEGLKRPVRVHYDEICIPNVSYYTSPHFSATNSLKRKENIGCSGGPVLFERDNALDTASGNSSHLQINSKLKMVEHSLEKPMTSRTADVSPQEILLNAAMNLASLKELHTVPSIRALRTTLIQQGVDKAIQQTKLMSSVNPECSVPNCSQDFSGQHFNSSLNNTHEVPSKVRSRTDTSASGSYNKLGIFQDSFDTDVFFTSNTARSMPEKYSSVLESSTNNCHNINCSQNCTPQSFHRKTSSQKKLPACPDVPSIRRKAIITDKPVRVNVGKLLSCSKIQVFFTTELYVNADCPSRLSYCKLHNMSLKSQASSNGEVDLITSFLQFMAFNASKNAFSTFRSQFSVANQTLRHKLSERNKLHATSPKERIVNLSKMSHSHAYNFLKCTCLSVETTESISSTFAYCKCPPSVKFQGSSASYTVMSSQTNTVSPRRQLIDMIHNIKSNLKDSRNICDGQHCFYFHVDEEDSIGGFYSTVEKYCSALSKFHSHQYTSSKSIEILLRDIWLPGHKYSISFYINLPLQKCKCSYCGLSTTVELCLNCGQLFERTELGNYVPFDYQKTPEHVDTKLEMSETAVKVLNLVNDLYLCKPVVVVQQTDISVTKQNKTNARRRKKPKHICC